MAFNPRVSGTLLSDDQLKKEKVERERIRFDPRESGEFSGLNKQKRTNAFLEKAKQFKLDPLPRGKLPFLTRTAGAVFPSFKEAGREIAGILTAKEQEEISINQAALGDALLKRIKNPRISDERKQELVRRFQEIQPDIVSGNPELQRTVLQKFGSALVTAATPAVVALGGAPATVGFGKGLLLQFGKGVLIGEAQGLGTQLSKGERSITKAAAQAIPQALITGTFFAAGFSIARGFRALTQKAPEALMKRALKQAPADLRKEVNNLAPNLRKQLIERGVKGSEAKIASTAEHGVAATERKITTILKDPNVGSKKFPVADLAKSLKKLRARVVEVHGKGAAQHIDDWIENVLLKKGSIIPGGGGARELTVRRSVDLKRAIYQELSSPSFNSNANLSEKSEMLRIIARELSKMNKRAAPALKGAIENQQMWIRTAQAMEGKIASEGRTSLIGLHESILAAGGDVKSITAAFGRRVFETTGIQSRLAVGLAQLDKIDFSRAAKITKATVASLLNKLLRGEQP